MTNQLIRGQESGSHDPLLASIVLSTLVHESVTMRRVT